MGIVITLQIDLRILAFPRQVSTYSMHLCNSVEIRPSSLNSDQTNLHPEREELEKDPEQHQPYCETMSLSKRDQDKRKFIYFQGLAITGLHAND